MINKQRVQRIRNFIYSIIVLIIFVPLILVIVLSLRLIGLLTDISAYFAVNPPAITQQIPEQSESDYVIAPEGQALTNDVGQALPEPDKPMTMKAGENLATDSGEFVANTYSPASYPDLYFDLLPTKFSTPKGKTLYLTFDNTPSSQIGGILAVLEEHNVKATFFVWWNEFLGNGNGAFYKTITDAGHTIGIHAASSEDTFSTVYSSKDYFLEVYDKIFATIYAETGIKTRLYRLPGGSVNPYDPNRQAVLAEIKQELDSRGFLQHDWNASAEDAVNPSLSKEQILSNMKSSISSDGDVVILLHDGTGSNTTAQALSAFITEFKASGYSFSTLDIAIRPVSFLDK